VNDSVSFNQVWQAVLLSPSSITWYLWKLEHTQGQHVMHYNSVSVISQHKLVSGWKIQKWISVPTHGLTWLGKDFKFVLEKGKQVLCNNNPCDQDCKRHWLLTRPVIWPTYANLIGFNTAQWPKKQQNGISFLVVDRGLCEFLLILVT